VRLPQQCRPSTRPPLPEALRQARSIKIIPSRAASPVRRLDSVGLLAGLPHMPK
jgi:hypothetical protein